MLTFPTKHEHDSLWTEGVLSELKSLSESYITFHKKMFQEWPEFNGTTLEAILVKSLKANKDNKVSWAARGHAPYDIQVNEKKIQVKGTLLETDPVTRIHLSSFRLGSWSKGGDILQDPSMELKQGILERLSQNDNWIIVCRQTTKDSLKIKIFVASNKSFIYNENLYNFSKVKKKKGFRYECEWRGIKTHVTPGTSYQLWYEIPYFQFSEIESGVHLIADWEFLESSLPNSISFNS